ncbi:MAG: phosphotransferase [Solirubrobacterales bacterium]|nr:phosphotransferase [Solirubrobacterales bacterium]
MTADVRDLARRARPGLPARTVERLGAGLDHQAFLVDGELVVRLGEDPAAEARVLELVAPLAPPAVPAPLLVEGDAMVYPLLPGTPLLALGPPPRDLAPLGRFLSRLHRLDAPGVARDDFTPEQWLADAREQHEQVAAQVPAAHRDAVGAFLAAPPPPPPPALALTHNDLGAEHLLADPATRAITGVIDWGDAAIADPAYDLGLLLRDLGDGVLAHYDPLEPPEDLLRRATFYARCAVFEDLAYGQEAYTRNALAAIGRLFGPSAPRP